MHRTAPLLILLWSGCGGMAVEDFEVDVLDELCQAAADCEATFDAESCYDLLRSIDRSRCDFDADAARDCADGIPEARCIDNGDLGTTTWEVPEACDAVYSCGPISLATE